MNWNTGTLTNSKPTSGHRKMHLTALRAGIPACNFQSVIVPPYPDANGDKFIYNGPDALMNEHVSQDQTPAGK
jgi:hypothetical protein